MPSSNSKCPQTGGKTSAAPATAPAPAPAPAVAVAAGTNNTYTLHPPPANATVADAPAVYGASTMNEMAAAPNDLA